MLDSKHKRMDGWDDCVLLYDTLQLFTEQNPDNFVYHSAIKT